jgi:hypothetical protein
LSHVIGRGRIASLGSALLVSIGVTTAVVGGSTAVDAITGFAPLNRPGPVLSVPVSTLRAASKCSDNFGT